MCIKKTMVGIGVTVGILAIGYLGYGQYQLMNEIKESNQNMANMNTAYQTLLAEQNARQLDSKELANAVKESIRNLQAEEAESRLQEKLSKYTLAPQNTPNQIRVYGNTQARFTLTSFSDTECPYCKRFHPTPKKIVEDSNGQINWVFKHLPLSFHNPAAELQAVASECVGEIKGNQSFWAYVDDIFELSSGGGKGVRNVMDLASTFGVNEAQFSECMRNEAIRLKVNNNVEEAQALGITGTPATVVTDNSTGRSIVVSGAQPAESLLSAVRRLSDTNAE